MKELLIKYKSVVKFILTFLIVYGLLSLLYFFYLKFSDGSKYYPDYLTQLVAKQTEIMINGFGYKTQIFPHTDEASIKVIVNGKYLSRVEEGCNAASVIILFISFVIAFSGRLKTTLFFILSGSVLVYIANLFRITLFNIAIYNYPEQQAILHDVLFPLVIYGFVFLLWIFWVNRFSNLKNKRE